MRQDMVAQASASVSVASGICITASSRSLQSGTRVAKRSRFLIHKVAESKSLCGESDLFVDIIVRYVTRYLGGRVLSLTDKAAGSKSLYGESDLFIGTIAR